MFFYEGQSCPVCGKAFAEKDDIVSCPECGAPHHRACWMSEGRCHFADRHGTPEQWSRNEQTEQPKPEQPKSEPTDGALCPHCGKVNPTFAEFCSRCGRPLKVREWSGTSADSSATYTPFHAPTPDAETNIPRNEAMDDDGTTVGDVALAIGVNQQYYLPRFRKMYAENKPITWNWLAFLFPSPWLFLRKNYLAGALILCLELAFLTTEQLLMIGPLLSVPTDASMLETWLLLAESVPLPAMLMAWMWALLHVFCGLFGTFMYRQSALSRCRRLKRNCPDDYQARLPFEGGVAPVLFALALLVVNVTPQIICDMLIYFNF